MCILWSIFTVLPNPWKVLGTGQMLHQFYWISSISHNYIHSVSNTMRYIRTVIVTVGTSQISKERKHFVRKTVWELLSFKFTHKDIYIKKNETNLSVHHQGYRRSVEDPTQGRFYLLEHPCFSISLSQKPGTDEYTWNSFLDLGYVFGSQFFDRRVGEGFGMFQVQSIYFALYFYFCSLVAPLIKSLPAMRKTRVQSLGQEDLLEKEMTVHSSILAWRIQWSEEPGGLQRAGHGWVTEHLFLVWFHQLHLRSSGVRS